MNNTINSVRYNSPSFGMSARLTSNALNEIKGKPLKEVRRILRRVASVDDYSESIVPKCNVEFDIVKPEAPTRGRKTVNAITQFTALVKSQKDSTITNNVISTDFEKIGNFSTRFFGKVKRSADKVSEKQETIDSLSKFLVKPAQN